MTNDTNAPAPGRKPIPIKVPDEVLRACYANNMTVSHTREEFIVDFMTVYPPQGVVTARVILSPGHAKRIVKALSENLARYESTYGIVEAAPEPHADSDEMAL